MFENKTFFISRYAGTVMEVYKVNEELNNQLKEVSLFTAQLTADSGNDMQHETWLLHSIILCFSAGPSLSMPEHIRENSKVSCHLTVTKLSLSFHKRRKATRS